MKRKFFFKNILIACTAFLFLFSNTAQAYWVWTPGTKKFVNPKNAVKDTPKEQFEWAMGFYNNKDYQRAIAEFEKLTKQYEYSEYASRAQYYVGLCYESMNKPYIAFQNYQKAIDNFPHIENMDEIVAREYNIANMFVVKESPRVLGADILTSLDRAIEIYKKVVENAPYGRLADEAQFKMGDAMKKAERYDEAIQAYQKIIDDYPTSTFVDKAKFEVADCANKASLKPAYDVEPTERAIKAFEDFNRENRDRTLIKEADKTIQRLKDKAAAKSMLTADFYERQGRYQSAIIYYQDVLKNYPDSTLANNARSRIEYLKARIEKPNGIFAPFKIEKAASKPKPAVEAPKPAEAPITGLEAPRPKGWNWNPFSFMKPSKPKKSWNPLSFMTSSKPKEVTAETPKPKKSWNPLIFMTSPKPKNAAPKPQKKAWTPLSFDKKKKEEKPAVAAPEDTAIRIEPVQSSVPAAPVAPIAMIPPPASTATTTETAHPAPETAPAAAESTPAAEKIEMAAPHETVAITQEGVAEKPSEITVKSAADAETEAKAPEAQSAPKTDNTEDPNQYDEIEVSNEY